MDGIESFLNFAREHLPGRTSISCPCNNCGNQRLPIPYDELEYHLTKYGFLKTYRFWNYHGEVGTPEGVSLASPSFSPQYEDMMIDNAHEVHNSVLHNLGDNIDGVVQDESNIMHNPLVVEDDGSIKFDSNLRKATCRFHKIRPDCCKKEARSLQISLRRRVHTLVEKSERIQGIK
ncbi:hypothetical protein GIB67_008955 [Kingdonia uniflora]|uniref:Transposase-associated domain-containing protein n=1 Tax=Kingdonia uniflora TaxID=39325 RepID=A0A7J7LVR7_9MAGN|nr:hypothetical protein GIB67_008955 [Kingdonia uniflora]